MEILGIGASELVFIVIIALIVLGPKDMQKAGKSIGKFLRDIVTSDGWKMFQQTSRELRTLPNRLIRDANEELNKIGGEATGSPTPAERPSQDSPAGRSNAFAGPFRSQPVPQNESENKIAPAPVDPNSQSGDTKKDA